MNEPSRPTLARGLATAMLAGALGGCSPKEDPARSTAKGHAAEAARNTAAPTGAASPAWFEDRARELGLTFEHRSGASGKFWIPEVMSGGVGLLDFDGDGWMDIFLVQGGNLEPGATPGTGSRLFKNLGQGRFTDVTASARIPTTGYGMGCACADYDGDGRTDLLITQLGRNVLLRNNGDGTFTDTTVQAGLVEEGWSTSAAFADYDADGRLDLVIARYLRWSPAAESECHSRGGARDYCSPLNYNAPAMDLLYHNEGGGRFKNLTLEAGLDKAYGNGLGVAAADFDGDGRIDLFVANDAMPNQLWVNRGAGTFRDEAALRGCAVNALGMTRAGMGVAVADLLEQGALDLFVTHLVGEGNGLFVNTPRGFVDTVTPRGPGAASLPHTGFGVACADFDNDGVLDLFVANGRVKLGPSDPPSGGPYAEQNTLLRGLGKAEFVEVFPQGGVSPARWATSRGVAAGDLDNDGRVDLVVGSIDGPARLLMNRVTNANHWSALRVADPQGAPVLNARLVATVRDQQLHRSVLPNQGYCSSHDPRVHLGLGAATAIDRVLVRWPDGTAETFGPLDADREHTLTRGRGTRSP